MEQIKSSFDENLILNKLKHYLPAQAPLKDFVHHNTLHAFQNKNFYSAIREASEVFGYKVLLSIDEYRNLFLTKKINKEILDQQIIENFGVENLDNWLNILINKNFDTQIYPRIGELRANWRKHYTIDLDPITHSLLFRIVSSYLDQGIAIWNFPILNKSFLESIKEIEAKSFSSFFKTKRAKSLLFSSEFSIKSLLDILVGDETLYEKYLFDQQFAHPGWSGLVSVVEDNPESLLDKKQISLKELILFELLLEIDALDYELGEHWLPLSAKLKIKPKDYFNIGNPTELDNALFLWQNAYELSYYNEVLLTLQSINNNAESEVTKKSFQVLFCIDDRACSLKRYLKLADKNCEAFSTPGFFNVEFYFKPQHGKFSTKVCPAPIHPTFLVKEEGVKKKREKDLFFTKQTHSLIGGWLISHTLGFWSAIKLFINIFKPSLSPAVASSFNHMYSLSSLTIENKSLNDKEDGLQIGFTLNEMADRVEGLLKSIGLIKNFAPIIYVIGHGSSSINNPHYAAYDCGACSGRPGSVNARVFSYMANHKKVREILKERLINIPEYVIFVGGLHDTTRDEILFFDVEKLEKNKLDIHLTNKKVFETALENNAKERSRRFDSINTNKEAKSIHKEIRERSVSLFEPRPELNHATNALCIVGKSELIKGLFLDRRAFMNSYDYEIDKNGDYLFSILKAVAPVCGGINLEYYFSRVDNQKLGAGTKLPHNVMGLFGVANGIDGDLRTGLPSQMIEVHDPIRLLVIVEQNPELLLEVIKRSDATYEWFINDWIHLVSIDPKTKKMFWFKKGEFIKYNPISTSKINTCNNVNLVVESGKENLPVYIISNDL